MIAICLWDPQVFAVVLNIYYVAFLWFSPFSSNHISYLGETGIPIEGSYCAVDLIQLQAPQYPCVSLGHRLFSSQSSQIGALVITVLGN